MFRRILIANRGEIACRIINTCTRLGIETVAVYSDPDATARHVSMADSAVALGGASPADSYLRGDAIIAAALEAGAEAIHPGYGFLSENGNFAQAVAEAGLVFIGPSPKAIRTMGLKGAAKAVMEAAGVPVVPGYHGEDQTNLAAKAQDIGYPLLIKAVAGGGGRGMRRVDRADEFDAALDSARREAEAAFGNSAVLIERFVSHPRHIEVQIFGDGTQAIHLFERDCSLQRRHQKVIEEAPAPGMTPQMRAAMGAAAVRAAEAVAYSGAGTVEFIVDASDGLHPDRFYFMEMNTRLQVEHPVTEAITGIDLVEWQLRVAAGEPLPCTQSDLSADGHAFEARLYAEDVPAGFLPATGRLEHLQFGAGRIETGVRAGDEISAHYDPMIAKVVVHGATRPAALDALDRALGDVQIGGTVTNLDFLRALVRHPGVIRGDVDTGLIARDMDVLSSPPIPCSKTRAIAAVASLGCTGGPLDGFALWASLDYPVYLEDVEARVRVEGPGCFYVQLDENTHVVEQGQDWRVDGVKTNADVHVSVEAITVFWGATYRFARPDPLARGTANLAEGSARAPMPGIVTAVLVAVGDLVQEGDALVVIEAMKMEHTLRAAWDGTVEAVHVTPGAQMAAGDILVEVRQ